MEEPYRVTPKLAVRVAILGVIAIGLFCALFFRLWALQVISGDEYRTDAVNNQIRSFRIEATRGTVLDRDGELLVTNGGGTIVRLWPATLAELPKERRQAMLAELSELLSVPVPEIQAKLKRGREVDPLSPVTIKRSVHEPKVNYLLEHQAEFPGVQISETQLRRYERETLAPHLFGYVAEISPEQLGRLEGDYAPGDTIGYTGVEAAYDTFLRGKPGEGQVPVDAAGRVTGEREFSSLPQPGNAIRLTIDADLQAAAEDAIREGIEFAQENYENGWAANGGSIVAMDPRNGEILAMASFPLYDPKIFVGRRDPKKLAKLEEPAANVPTLNRATAGLYPPGSTFKPVTAIAAMMAGELQADEFIQCVGEREIDGQVFKNWDEFVNEPMELTRALAASCDTYFYDVALRFFEREDSPMQDWAGRMGFGGITGLDIGPEGEGLVPTPEWRREYFETEVDKLWTSGDSVQLAIGQGDLLVTPLQMTRFYAMIANGGMLVNPHLVQSVEEVSSEQAPPLVLREFSPAPPKDVGIDPTAIRVVQEGLLDATHAEYGTSASVFGAYDVAVAGKTGTAEKYVRTAGYEGLLDQSWWCGYGPVDDPEITVCALIENGGKGAVSAAPAALRVFEEYFGVAADYELVLRETD